MFNSGEYYFSLGFTKFSAEERESLLIRFSVGTAQVTAIRESQYIKKKKKKIIPQERKKKIRNFIEVNKLRNKIKCEPHHYGITAVIHGVRFHIIRKKFWSADLQFGCA